MKDVRKVDMDGIPVYLKRDSFGKGYRIVHPFKNDDGSWNYFNLFTGGSWWNLILLIFIVVMLVGSVWAYKRDMQVCTDLVNQITKEPCKWCDIVTRSGFVKTKDDEINWTAMFEKMQEVIENETESHVGN